VCQVELPGCSGIWTVYHKAERDDATEFDFGTSETEEFHAYLIISLESRTMVCICTNNNCDMDSTAILYVCMCDMYAYVKV
jgi:cleavage and polyadenylation specificity factor subunit 1